MFGLSFTLDGAVSNGTLQAVDVTILATHVCIYCPSTAATTFSHTRADLEPMYNAVYICLFVHSPCIAPTARLPAGCIWPPPDDRQPRGRMVTCDVVGA